ncbi:hypothetical protein PPSIR1_18202 [Plesiocystis pacifica SIR-1]|uniref:Uncharacterized protein n=1 Tax=Plesiocystis pacifica SIR-1 TaxID=391625 RepID=A6GBV5_9BACT|nr:hypothetical protein [Plesiocystis pacifica]EDM76628.1 hypothetical protein PPSIR1_18202 [Plesiocystis pacifica SIR-1]
MILDVQRERTQAEWWFVDTIEERRADERFARAVAVERGAPALAVRDAPSQAGPTRAPAP